MAHRVRNAIARHPEARRVLVAVGCEHTGVMRQLLLGESIAIELAPPVEPDACVTEWERSVAAVTSEIAGLKANDPLRERLGRKVDVLKLAIASRGCPRHE
jgi:hypothetical protein